MIYLFDNKEKLIHIVNKSNIAEATQVEEANKTLTLDVEFKSIDYKIVEQAEYVGHYYKDTFYMYKIVSNRIKESNTIKAIYILFDELKANGYIRDKRPTNALAADAARTILEGTRWTIGKDETGENNRGTTNWYDKTRLDALTDLINKWGIELGYRIDFDGININNRYIDLYARRGEDTGLRLVYGTNLLEVEAESSKAGIYTAIIGRGKGEQITDEDGHATGGYGRRIDFKAVEWSKAAGDPLDKPTGQEYVENKAATALYGYSNGKPRIKISVFEDCTDAAELLKLSYKELMQVSRPQVTFNTTIGKLNKSLDIGDVVKIIRRDINIFYTARVFKIERDLLDENNTRLKIGDYIESNAAKSHKAIQGKLQSATAAIKNLGDDMGVKVNKLLQDLKNGIELQYFNDNAFNYELGNNNKWQLPAGYYSFDRPIDKDPSKVIYMGAGKIMIANRKTAAGAWNWSTFGTGDGFTADKITTGILQGGNVQFNLNNGSFLIGNSASDYLMKYDGSTLKFGSKADTGIPDWVRYSGSTTIGGNSVGTARLMVGTSSRGVFIGENVINGQSGIVGYNSPDVTFNIKPDGTFIFGKGSKQITCDTSGRLKMPQITADDIQAGTITAREIKAQSITGSEVERETLTGRHIEDDSITSDKIRSITVDILRPGRNNRIIFEGSNAGDNDVKSIDATGSGIRLKADRRTYVACYADDKIQFFSRGGSTKSVDSDLVANSFIQTSDVRAKENIKYLGHTDSIKPNEAVTVEPLTIDNITDFFKGINLATYNYIFENNSRISAIAQNVEKYEQVSKYLVKESEGRKYIDTSNLLNMSVAAIQELLKSNEQLSNRVTELERSIKNGA